MVASGHSISPLRPEDDTHTYELNDNVTIETKDRTMKKLLILALVLAANLASAQNHRHSPAPSPVYRGHYHAHGYRPLPAPGLVRLPSAPAGYWTTQYDTVYVAGAYVTMLNAYGQPQLTFVPGHYETISRQVWVARVW